jgi:hypothetical protein
MEVGRRVVGSVVGSSIANILRARGRWGWMVFRLLAPALVLCVMWALIATRQSSDAPVSDASWQNGIARCQGTNCVTVMYWPVSSATIKLMQRVASATGLVFGVDIVPWSPSSSASTASATTASATATAPTPHGIASSNSSFPNEPPVAAEFLDYLVEHPNTTLLGVAFLSFNVRTYMCQLACHVA